MSNGERKNWALVLGASSGFGGAASLELARAGYSIFGVHLDRKSTMPNVERLVGEIEAIGQTAVFFNVNAADAEKRDEVLAEMAKRTDGGAVRDRQGASPLAGLWNVEAVRRRDAR